MKNFKCSSLFPFYLNSAYCYISLLRGDCDFVEDISLKYHLDRRRDFPEPGPPDTRRGGIGAGAATRSLRRS